MTKLEAIQQMKVGQKLTHRHFTNDEWVTMEKSISHQYIIKLEDGVKCTQEQFWKWRTDESWNFDWEIFKN